MEFNKRVIAAIAAVVLAVAGVTSVVAYARDADERAFDGTDLRQVWQVTAIIPAGTGIDQVRTSAKLVKLPATAVAKGALTDLDEVSGLQTTTSLQPGEQLILARFAKPGAATKSESKSDLPAGMQELTIALTAPRLVGGHLKSGDTVGIFASYDTERATAVLQNRVLVVRVQDSVGQNAGDQQATSQVTFAVKTLVAEKIVHAAEFGHIWLSRQDDETELGTSVRIESGDVFK